VGIIASLVLSQTQPPPYGYRVTAYLFPQTLVWILLILLWVLRLSSYDEVSLYSQLMLIAFGLAAGVTISAGVTRKQLSKLTDKGEMSMSLSTLMILIGGVLVFVALLLAAMFAFPSLSQLIYVVAMDFMVGAGISLAVGRAYFMVDWERTHKMHLYQKGWSLKMYAVPKPDSS
jgi:hypothetical protein